MNAIAIWKTTSATIDRRQRWFMAVSWVSMTLFALVLLRRSNSASVAAMTYGFGLAFWWTFVVGRALLLQRDAKLLRIPDIDRTVCANLVLQYGLSVLLPAAAFAVLGGGDFARIGALLSCIVAAAILFQVLPRYLSMFMAIAPSTLQYLSAHRLIPGVADAGFPLFGWTLAGAMAAIATWRWLVVLKTDPDAFGSWSIPMVIQMRTQIGLEGGFKNWDSNILFGASRKTTLHANVQLVGITPNTPIRALRVWLGGAFAPVTLSTRLGQGAFVFLPVLIAIAFGALGMGKMQSATVFAMTMGGTFVPLIFMGIAPARLQRLYNNARGEISLLALLPGFDPATTKRNLRMASLGVPLVAQAGLYLIMLSLGMAFRASATLLFALSLSSFGAAAFGTALSLNIMAGRRVPGFVLGLICVLGSILLCTTLTVLPLRDRSAAFSAAANGAMIGWLVLFALFTWLGVRGWRTFARRAHPFLLNDG